MRNLVFAALIAAGGFAASIAGASAMTPASPSQTGASSIVQDVHWDKHRRHHHHYRHHHYKHHKHHRWYAPKNYHRGEDRDLHFHHDPRSQWKRDHRRIQ